MFVLATHTLGLSVHALLHGATAFVVYLWIRGESAVRNTKFMLALGLLLAFFVVNAHEFLASGVWYRTYWSLPYLTMFHFIILWQAFSKLPKIARGMVWSIFYLLLILGHVSTFFSIQQQRTPQNFLDGPHAKIYVGNEAGWTKTVNTVSAFLQQNLQKDELFLALPYDCIYYYLTDKPSPTRQLIFFDHIKITPEQETQIIQELEAKNIKYVLMSNRFMSSETGLGIFGKTYCPLLSSYIAQKFAPFTREGGDWQKEPGWGNNHGVMILKRK